MAATKIETNTYYKEDMIIKETIVDGDIFEIVELYLDEEGEVIYEYKHDYAANQLLKIHNELLAGVHDRDYYGAVGELRKIQAHERRLQLEKEKEEREKELAKQRRKEQYNAKMKKKLEKNRKRG